MIGTLEIIRLIAITATIISAMGIAGWVVTTQMRVRHGYPLAGEDGQLAYPGASNEAAERVKLLTSENAQLRAELGSVKDRLAVVERIVTDGSHRLGAEIEQLRGSTN